MGRKFRLLLAAGTVALAAIVATTALAQTHARGAEPFKIALSNSFIGNKWRIEMENDFKSACGMPPYKTAGPMLRLQLGQRRLEADAADLEPDLAGRRCDPRRRRLRHRPERDHPAGLRARHRRGRLRQPRDRAVCDQDQREPVRLRSAERAVHRRQAQGQGQCDHGDGCRRHAGRHRPEPGSDGRLQEVPGHQGRLQVHRDVGLGDRPAQHGAAAAVAAEDRRRLVLRRHRRDPQGDARRRPAAADGRRRRGRERLPPVPRRLQRQEARSTASRSASRRSTSCRPRGRTRPCSPSRTRCRRRRCGCRSRRRPRRRRSSA